MLPFYKTHGTHLESLPVGSSTKANLGLFFSRFFSWSSYDLKDKRHIDAKTRFLKQFTRKDFGSRSQLERLALRQMLLNQALKSESLFMRSDWHWVTGMGNSHPLENGFTWHHTLSMPYLSGSSVKGILRSFCELNQLPKAQIRQWFGSESKNPEHCDADHQAGELLFFDAIPYDVVDILPDVMTPHTGDWQESGDKGKTAPADWHVPNPVGFLVAKKLRLMFSLALAPHSKLTQQDLATAKELLEQALGFLGAGAKTATGYGTMSPDPDAQKKFQGLLQSRQENLQQQKAAKQQATARQQMSEQQRVIEDLLDDLSHEQKKAAAMQQVEALANGGVASWSAEDRTLLATKLRAHDYAKVTNKDKAKARKALISKIEQG
jgi:CRISPR-associated protein Cmr6